MKKALAKINVWYLVSITFLFSLLSAVPAFAEEETYTVDDLWAAVDFGSLTSNLIVILMAGLVAGLVFLAAFYIAKGLKASKRFS